MPGVFVASTAFASAARAQARALDVDLAWVLVDHPIQNRTDAELHALADGAIDAIVNALCS